MIRSEQPGDEPGIRIVHQAAFPTEAESRLVDELRRTGNLRISLVAVVDERIVGHVAFSPVKVDSSAPPDSVVQGSVAQAVNTGATGGLGLAPLAVLPDFERRGIGAALVRAGLYRCRTERVGHVVVLGSPRYYGRFGFRAAREWRLVDEYQGGDHFQALEIITGTIPAGGGLVRFGREFGALDA